MAIFRRAVLYTWTFLATNLLFIGVALAQDPKPKDDLLEELFGPPAEVISSLKAEARIGTAANGASCVSFTDRNRSPGCLGFPCHTMPTLSAGRKPLPSPLYSGASAGRKPLPSPLYSGERGWG